MAGVIAGPVPEPQPDAAPGDAALLAPVEPSKIVCICLNYMDHIRECGLDVPQVPVVFAKFPSSVAGPTGPIRVPTELTTRVDWEVELAVVIDVQFSDGQWVRGKSLDTFCAVGPVVVTADEVGDPQALRLTTRVNGELV